MKAKILCYKNEEKKIKRSFGQARSCLYAKNQLLAHHFGKKFFCLH
jgi:hypothetical protein